MGRWSSSPTMISDALIFSIHDLKKWGYLKPYHKFAKNTYTWTRNGNKRGEISFTVDTNENDGFVELSFTYKKTEEVNYKVPLVALPSNLGKGLVWYFICPFTGKRCRKLYAFGKNFAHREAFNNIFYEKQLTSKRYRKFEKYHTARQKAEKACDTLRAKHFTNTYKGKLTKRAKEAYKAINDFDNSNFDYTSAVMKM